MRSRPFSWSLTTLVASLLLLLALPCFAATPSLTQQVDPQEISVGDEFTVTFTIQNGTGTIRLPTVDGLQVTGSTSSTNITLTNNGFSSAASQGFRIVATKAGDLTIPAFDIKLQGGEVLHAQPTKIRVLSSNSAPPAPTPVPTPPNLRRPNIPGFPGFNPQGPVVMPPNANPPVPPGTDPNVTTQPNSTEVQVPTEADGRPAKVFMVITPQTTDAYVGESIPLRIEFYLRMDVASQQDSLPVIKGSNFLMNNLSPRPREEYVTIMNESFHRETWITAITAPKNGDFPLEMVRNTYWVKSTTNQNFGFGFFNIRQPNLAHEMIASNPLTIHVNALPSEGRPANFTGAIGKFSAIGVATPESVAVGEPVNLRFSISGEGNFDYIHSPALSTSPDGKSYIGKSKIEYQDESRTQGEKTFTQEVIPKKNGILPLPKASFSYFDLDKKAYVQLDIPLPPVTVTGSATAAAAPASPDDSASYAELPASEWLANRLTLGSLSRDLAPIHRHAWYWITQGIFLAAVLGAVAFLFLRPQAEDENAMAERLARTHSRQREESAMHQAVQEGNTLAFFVSARHAIQLKLGERWGVHSEAITLGEIRERDPELATALEPFFTQVDEVIYSGGTGGRFDLAQWERHVQELLHSEPQPA